MGDVELASRIHSTARPRPPDEPPSRPRALPHRDGPFSAESDCVLANDVARRLGNAAQSHGTNRHDALSIDPKCESQLRRAAVRQPPSITRDGGRHATGHTGQSEERDRNTWHEPNPTPVALRVTFPHAGPE